MAKLHNNVTATTCPRLGSGDMPVWECLTFFSLTFPASLHLLNFKNRLTEGKGNKVTCFHCLVLNLRRCCYCCFTGVMKLKCILFSSLLYVLPLLPMSFKFSKERFWLDVPSEKLRRELEEELKLSSSNLLSHGWYHGHIPWEVRLPCSLKHLDILIRT